MVTVKLHESPLLAAQMTPVGPTGKKAPDGGLQTTSKLAQLPEAVGVVYVTTAPHWFGVLSWVMLAGQLMVQPVDEESTVVEVEAVLSAWCNSLVLLVTEAASVTPEPLAAVMLKARLKIAVAPAGSEAIVQL